MVQDISTQRPLSTAIQNVSYAIHCLLAYIMVFGLIFSIETASRISVLQPTKTPGSKRPAPFEYKLCNWLRAIS